MYVILKHGVTPYLMILQVGFMGQNSHISSEFDEVGFFSSKCCFLFLNELPKHAGRKLFLDDFTNKEAFRNTRSSC